jgi:hypothetical protein
MIPNARALGGGVLSGDKLVRYVYLDETGTGDPAKEPFVIVAGVMIHAVASEWKAVENHLKFLADGFALPEDRPGFCFHANELFTGVKGNSRISIHFKSGMLRWLQYVKYRKDFHCQHSCML